MNIIPTPESDAIVQTSIKYKDILKLREYYKDHLGRLEIERNEARFDLEFRRELYKLQEQTLNLYREQRDEARKMAKHYHDILKYQHMDKAFIGTKLTWE